MRGLHSSARARRVALLCAITGIVTACSTDNVLDVRPSVDVGETGGIHSAQPIPKQAFREARPGTFEPEAPEADYGASPDESYQTDARPTYDQKSAAEPDYSGENAGMNGGDPRDRAEQYLRSSSEPQYSEPETAEPEYAEPETAEPEYIEPQARVRPAPRNQTLLAGFPRITPRIEPGVSSVEAACRKELKRAGVRFEDLAPIRKSNSCYIDNPVKVSAIGNVQMKPAATLTCRMALTFAQWTNKELVPSARWRYFTGIKSIRQGSSYSCRSIAGSRTPSAHSTGNALDVMAIELNNGKTIDIRKQGFFAFRAKKLLNNVRADGCQYFTTVLGPGYNYDHRDHFHFDLMERKNGRRACH